MISNFFALFVVTGWNAAMATSPPCVAPMCLPGEIRQVGSGQGFHGEGNLGLRIVEVKPLASTPIVLVQVLKDRQPVKTTPAFVMTKTAGKDEIYELGEE